MILVPIMPKGKYAKMYDKPYVMLLSHLADDPEYYAAANDPRYNDVYRMNDNSIIELGESVSLDTILEAAKKLRSNEIILRDAYPNGPETIKVIQEDLEQLRKNGYPEGLKIMGVCHGRNREEFKATFDFLNAQPEITCIGIPKVLSTWCENGNRASLFDIWGNTDKEIHLLGVWYSLQELLDMPWEVLGRIRSCDTCLPAVYAINGQHIWEDRKGTIDLEHEYPELTDETFKRVMDEWYEAIYKKAAKDEVLG